MPEGVTFVPINLGKLLWTLLAMILDQDICELSSGTLWETLARPLLGGRYALSSLLLSLVLILLHAFNLTVFNAVYGLVGL